MRQKIIVAAVLLLFGLILPCSILEVLFRFEPQLLDYLKFGKEIVGDSREMTAPHARYGISGNVYYAGHDSNGWRNKERLKHADIIV